MYQRALQKDDIFYNKKTLWKPYFGKQDRHWKKEKDQSGAVRETYLQSFDPDSGIEARTTNKLLLRFEFNIKLLPLLKVRFFYRIFAPLLNALF